MNGVNSTYICYIFVNIIINMNKITKIVLLLSVLNGFMLTTWADRGVGKKKAKVSLNLGNSSVSRSGFNIKSNLKYNGSSLNTNSNSYNNLVTYQKGNTVYMVPFKQKVVVPEMKQGYTGMKLIIKTKL